MLKRKGFISIFLAFSATLATGLLSSTYASEPTYKANVPKSLTTPEQRWKQECWGEIHFLTVCPVMLTVKKTYDFLDLSRAVECISKWSTDSN